MQLDITLAYPVVVPTPIVPPQGRYYRVLEDIHTAEASMDDWRDGNNNPIPIRWSVWRLPAGGGAPATKKSRYDHWTKIGEAFQRHEFEVWKLYAPAGQTEAQVIDAHTRFHGGQLAWCNGTGMTGNKDGIDRADFVAGKYAGLELPARESLCNRGNILKLQDGFTAFGDAWWPFDCWDMTSFLATSPLDIARMFWKTHFASVQNNNKLPDNTYQIDRFPHNRDPLADVVNDVPLPILTRDGAIWLERWAVQEIPYPTERPNPYNPPKEYSPEL